MSLGSTGLFVPISTGWGAKYVDGTPPYTNFSKYFHVNEAYWYLVLSLEVLTTYENYAQSAVVQVNNQQIGTIEPRPQVRYQDLQPYSIYFPAGVLSGTPGSYTGPQALSIKPVSTVASLVVGKWHVLYNKK